MANSRSPLSLGQPPLQLPVDSAMPLGQASADSSGIWPGLLADTPGPLGCNDHACPEAIHWSLQAPRLHLDFAWDAELIRVTLAADKTTARWDYDPDNLLANALVAPGLVDAAKKTLQQAVADGLRPRVHEAYRSAERSDKLNKKAAMGEGGRAAPAWKSAHNYGLAIDIWLYDAGGHYISNKVKGWYKLYKRMNKAAKDFVWGEPFNDADHWEYHPKWSGPATGKFLLSVKEWAMKAVSSAAAPAPAGKPGAATSEPELARWLPYVWWAAGAGGVAPPATFLTKNPPPAP
jgi:hypothetical protein